MRTLGTAGGRAIEPNSNVLRRKLRSEPSGPDEQAVSPVKAARMALARASEKAFNLALRVSSIRQSRLDLAEAVEQIEEDWALFPLVHDDGSVGVMCLEPACIIAFVERQTLGHVRETAVETRRLTSTDKALAISFLEVFLRKFDEALKDAPTAYWTCGYRPEDAVTSRHLMVLQLDASEYRGFDAQSEVVGTDRSIGLRLFLPIKEKNNSRSDPLKIKKPKPSPTPTQKGKTLHTAALAASVEMDAIMCRFMLPLSELDNLKPGQLVPLPQNATQHAYLVDRVGRTEQSIHLGQLHGLRAVRLHKDIAHEAIRDTSADNTPNKVSENKALLPDREGKKPHTAEEEVSDAGKIDELDELLQASKN